MNVSDEPALLTALGWGKLGRIRYRATDRRTSSRGTTCDAYYFRTSDQYELDFVVDVGKELWAVEVKLTSSPSPADMDRLNRPPDMIGAKRRFLVTKTNKPAGDALGASFDLSSLMTQLRGLG